MLVLIGSHSVTGVTVWCENILTIGVHVEIQFDARRGL